MSSQLEREEEAIEQEYADGLISNKERNKSVRELYADYRASAEQAAEEAYNEVMDRW